MTIVDGRTKIGDSGCTDDCGPIPTIGCKKDTTTIVGGKNTSFVLTEDATDIRLTAVYVAAAGDGKLPALVSTESDFETSYLRSEG